MRPSATTRTRVWPEVETARSRRCGAAEIASPGAPEEFADEAWAHSRDPKTGLFHFGGRGPTLLDQAAMVQVYAELAG